jgi:hypothetical protein
MRYLIVILLCIGFQAEGQIIRANPFYTSRTFVAPATDTLLLDSFPAIVGYSLRKLRTNYSGNCIRVRRSNDNTEQNIGFVNNYLDTASMKTFVGANNGFVTTWYSQGDSAFNFSQGNAARQPRIINSGTIDKIHGKISMAFFQNGSNLSVPSSTSSFSFLHKTGQSAIFILSKVDSVGSRNYVLINNNNEVTTGIGIDLRVNIPVRSLSARVSRGVSGQLTSLNTTDSLVIKDSLKIQTILFDNANATASNRSTIYVDGSNQTNNNILTNSPSTANAISNITIGCNSSNCTTATQFRGYMGEIIIYNTDQSANRTAIENNINRNWLIY